MRHLSTLLLLSGMVAAAGFSADPPKSPAPPAAQQPRAASMTIEFEETTEEAAPPAPQGEQRRAIGDYIRDNSSDVRDCYAKRLQERPTLQGKVVARFDIGPRGKVIGASADGISDRELLLCVVTAVRKWEFEKPQGGGKLRIAYPFKFEPQPAR